MMIQEIDQDSNGEIDFEGILFIYYLLLFLIII